MKTGLCSVTFRALSIPEITELIRKAGLDSVEWGGDIHVPHGNIAAAQLARKATADAGLETSSYGSYYSPLDAEGNPEDFTPILETVLELGADTIRIWAGRFDSEKTSAEYRSALVDETVRISTRAEKQGIKVAFEFHAGTLTDTNESADKLYQEINHPNLYAYWQPPYWVDDRDYHFQGQETLNSRTLTLHVFHWMFHSARKGAWIDKIERCSLLDGESEWRRYLTFAAENTHYALLEFVLNDDPEQFLKDARTLKQWLGT